MDRTTPHSNDAEQALIGALILDRKKYESISEIVTEEDFYIRRNGIIFNAVVECIKMGQAPDIVALEDYLSTKGKLELVGGTSEIMRIMRNTPSAANAVHYALKIHDKAQQRNLIEIGTQIQDLAYGSTNFKETIREAEKLVMTVTDREVGNQSTLLSPKPLIKSLVKDMERALKGGGGITSIRSGINALDRFIGGFQPGKHYIIAARPAMGKTSLAMNIAFNAALRQRRVTNVFSLEMPSKSLITRGISSQICVPTKKIQRSNLKEEEYVRFVRTSAELANAPFYVDDAFGITPSQFCARVRRQARERGRPGLIVVDYLGLMRADGKYANKTHEIEEIANAMMEMAKEMSCAVISLAQLNRDCEKRPDKRPVPSDLKDSGSLEQSADVILFPFRPSVYDPMADPTDAEIIIGKHREGSTGSVRCSFNGAFTRFYNYTPRR